MIVIADTSPLNYLVLIGEVDVLRRLYGRVVIPEAVFSELQHPEAPAAVLAWMGSPPVWIEIREAIVEARDAGLLSLGAGERQAILLAQEHPAEALLLMDEGKGRREGIRRKLRVTGTLGVLGDAASKGWVDLPSAIERLRHTSFRASPSLLQSFLERYTKKFC